LVAPGAAILLALATAAPATGGSLRVGAARVDVTPPANPEYPPPGRYDHERLYVRAIVLDNGATRAALVGVDLSGLSEDVWKEQSRKIADELGCPVANVILSATHSHSARPAGPQPAWRPGGPTGRMVPENVDAAFLDAVRQARARLQPARVGFGTGLSHLNVNRDTVGDETHRWTQAANLDGPSDKTVAVLSFTRLDGSPIGAYVNYAMHPVNGWLAGITSADFCGAASRWVERAFGDEMVMVFSQGASGDQNPLALRTGTNAMASKTGVRITGYELVREDVEAPLRDGKVPHGTLDPEVADQLMRWIDSQGIVLGEEVIRVMSRIRPTASDVRLWGAQETLTCPGRRRTDSGREGAPGTYEDGEAVEIRLGVLGIGDTALTSVNGEVYTRIWQRLKSQSPMANTVMVTLANGRGNSGYIVDDRSYGAYTFQVLGSRLEPGCAEQGMADGLTRLISAYLAR
jgi:hypothetical protein